MNSSYSHRITQQIGEVINIDVDKNSLGWGLFLRVRVWVNITKPILLGTLLKQEGIHT